MELYANDATTTLNGTINNVVTTLVVTSASSFPATGNFRIKIDTEILLVTGVSGTTFTVTRGVESTTAATHTNGATINHILTAASLVNVVTQHNSFGVLASRPAAGQIGRIYRPTDSMFQQYDTGTVWRNMLNGMVLDKTIPSSATLLAGSWAWRNQGGASIADANDGFTITQPTSATENQRGIMRAVPATPYTFIAGIQGTFPENQYFRAGIFWHDGTKSQTLTLTKSISSISVGQDNYNSDTSYNATPVSLNFPPAYGGALFLKLRDDGTLRYWDVSPDLTNWTRLVSTSRTTFMTPTHYGVLGNNNNNAFGGALCKCFYMDEF